MKRVCLSYASLTSLPSLTPPTRSRGRTPVSTQISEPEDTQKQLAEVQQLREMLHKVRVFVSSGVCCTSTLLYVFHVLFISLGRI